MVHVSKHTKVPKKTCFNCLKNIIKKILITSIGYLNMIFWRINDPVDLYNWLVAVYEFVSKLSVVAYKYSLFIINVKQGFV